LAAISELDGDAAEDVDDDELRAAGGGVRRYFGVVEKLEEAFLQAERVGAVQRAADYQGDRAGGVATLFPRRARPWFARKPASQALVERPLVMKPVLLAARWFRSRDLWHDPSPTARWPWPMVCEQPQGRQRGPARAQSVTVSFLTAPVQVWMSVAGSSGSHSLRSWLR
jgi:hypothetical protein